MKIKLLTLLSLVLISFEAFSCIQMCEEPYCNSSPMARIASNPTSGPSYYRQSLKNGGFDALNIKNVAAERIKLAAHSSNKKSTNAATAISIAKEDVEQISSPRNTWLTFFGIVEPTSMDIGVADMVSPQTWTLPTGLLDSFTYYYNDDFIPITEVPTDLIFPDANKVLKSQYLDEEENIINLYEQYKVSDDSVTFIGSSYYYYLEGDDDAIDFTDFKFTDIPLSLGDSYQFRQDDDGSNKGLKYYIRTKTVDAFGTLQTPYGNIECLRISITTDQYVRSDSSSAYTQDASFYGVGFVSKEGIYFSGITDGVSGTVSMEAVELKVVAPTGILSPQSEVQINNDGDGVLISNTGVYIDVLSKTADPNALLDLESDDKGIMIPRLEQANRPEYPNEGLLIYQLDSSPGFYYFDGSSWTRLDNTTSAPSARVATSNQNEHAKIKKKGINKLENGTAFIPLNTSNGLSPDKFLIHLQAEGECNGLYISKKTSKGFEVKEQNNGKSNIQFSWTLNQL